MHRTQVRIAKLRDLLYKADPDRWGDIVETDNHITGALDGSDDFPNAIAYKPMLVPDLRDFPAGSEVLWNGQRITRGTNIRFQTTEKQPDGTFQQVVHEGTVRHVGAARTSGPHKFVMEVDDWDSVQTRHNVVDTQIREVVSPPKHEVEPGSFDLFGPDVTVNGKRATVGATVKYIRPDGLGGRARVIDGVSDERGTKLTVIDSFDEGKSFPHTTELRSDDILDVVEEGPEYLRLKVGDTISYDGRQDGGTSEAVVTDIRRTDQYRRGMNRETPEFVIEGITTENSLKPNTMVSLTPDRMNGVSRVDKETVTPVPEPQPLAIAADPGTVAELGEPDLVGGALTLPISYTREGKLWPSYADASIAPDIQRLLDHGWITAASHSGVGAEHPGRDHKTDTGYLAFTLADTPPRRRQLIRQAAAAAGFDVLEHGVERDKYDVYFEPAMGVYTSKLADGTSNEEVRVEAGKRANEQIGLSRDDPTPSGARFMEWLDARDAIKKQMEAEHGGTLLDTDEKLTQAWRTFFDVLHSERAPEALEPGAPTLHPPSESVTLPKSGKLREPAQSALAAIDSVIHVPEMHGPIPVRATSGKNARGGFLRRPAEGGEAGPVWEGPTVRMSGFGPGRGIVPAKRADELQPGDEVLRSGGYRFTVVSTEPITKEVGFGRPPVERVRVTLDRGEDWGESRMSAGEYKPDELLGFNWKPDPSEIPEVQPLLPHEIKVSVQEAEEPFDAEATLVHEMGHYIDNQAFYPYAGGRGMGSTHAAWSHGAPEARQRVIAKAREESSPTAPVFDQFESVDPVLAEWYDAVQATPEVDQLGSASMMEMATHKYLLSPAELWARSFAQYVALRSDDPSLMEWLRRSQNQPDTMTRYRDTFDREQRKTVKVPYEAKRPNYLKLRQWQDENFEPVAAAMDRLFDGLGWARGGRGRDRDAVGLPERGVAPGPGGRGDLGPALPEPLPIAAEPGVPAGRPGVAQVEVSPGLLDEVNARRDAAAPGSDAAELWDEVAGDMRRPQPSYRFYTDRAPDGSLAGAMVLSDPPYAVPAERLPDGVTLDNTVVLGRIVAAERGQGSGSRLLQEALRYAAGNDKHLVGWSMPGARHWYDRQGFQVERDRRVYRFSMTPERARMLIGESYDPGFSTEIDPEAWRMPVNEYAPFPRGEGDLTEPLKGYRERKNRWEAQTRKALSLGQTTQEEAEARGYHGTGQDSRHSILELGRPIGGWQTMPPDLWHVTTAASAVRRDGLKTREELGQERGAGLGGGESNTISFTTNPDLAVQIEQAIREMRAVVRGDFSVQEMIDRARSGDSGSGPFMTDWMQGWDREWKDGDPLPLDVRDALDGVRRGHRTTAAHGVMLGTEEEVLQRLNEVEPGNWRLEPGQESRLDAPKGKLYVALQFIRDATLQEAAEDRSDLFKRWLTWREQHGGSSDPLFFLADLEGLRNIPSEEIQTLRFGPRENGRGYPLAGMNEWRTSSGQAVELADGESMEPGVPSAPDLMFKHERHEPTRASPQLFRYVIADTPGGKRVGLISWSEDLEGVHIDSIAVEPSQQGKGVASKMLDELHQFSGGRPIIHGGFSSLQGVRFGVYRAAAHPETDKLVLDHKDRKPIYWKPGDPIPGDSKAFWAIPYGQVERAPQVADEAMRAAAESHDPGLTGGSVEPDPAALPSLEQLQQAHQARRALTDAMYRRNQFEAGTPDYERADQEVERRESEANAAEQVTNGRVFRMTDDGLGELRRKLADLSKRAEKIGVAPPQLHVQAEELIDKPDGGVSRRTYVTVEGKEPKIAGWEFVATLQHLGGPDSDANIIRRVPGSDEDVSLDQYRTGSGVCDYCHTLRDRKDTFILKGEDGELKQVGRNCLRDFLGHGSPEQLASYLDGWQQIDDLTLEDEERERSGGGGKTYMPLEPYLAHVATMVRTQGWTPRSAAGFGQNATADDAADNYYNQMRQKREKGQPAWVEPTEEDKAAAAAALEWARNLPGDTEFEHNLKTMVAGTIVPDRGEGFAAYAIVGHARAMEKAIKLAREREQKAASEHVGTVGERTHLRLRVEGVTPREGDYGMTYITRMADEHGNIVKWFGSKELTQGEWYEGDWQVKKHDEWQGGKETIVTRPTKLDVYDPNAPPPPAKPTKKGERTTVTFDGVDFEIEKAQRGFDVWHGGSAIERETRTWAKALDAAEEFAREESRRRQRAEYLNAGLPEGQQAKMGNYNPLAMYHAYIASQFVQDGDLVALRPKREGDRMYEEGDWRVARPPEDNTNPDLVFVPARVERTESGGTRAKVTAPDGVEMGLGELEVIVKGAAESLDPGARKPVTIKSAGVAYGFPYVDIEPTVLTDQYGKSAMIYSFSSDGGVRNPTSYVYGRGLAVKKDGTVGKASTTSFIPAGGIPASVLEELRRVSGGESGAESFEPGLPLPAPKWQRVEDGYRSADGRIEIWDNGAGVGPARGGGRWALMIDGKWIANIDMLTDAKRQAQEILPVTVRPDVVTTAPPPPADLGEAIYRAADGGLHSTYVGDTDAVMAALERGDGIDLRVGDTLEPGEKMLVEFHGDYVTFDKPPTAEQTATLKAAGYDGFVSGDELVIWNAAAIDRFGPWVSEALRESATEPPAATPPGGSDGAAHAALWAAPST